MIRSTNEKDYTQNPTHPGCPRLSECAVWPSPRPAGGPSWLLPSHSYPAEHYQWPADDLLAPGFLFYYKRPFHINICQRRFITWIGSMCCIDGVPVCNTASLYLRDDQRFSWLLARCKSEFICSKLFLNLHYCNPIECNYHQTWYYIEFVKYWVHSIK